MQKLHEDVSEYYGKILESSDDLKTGACCSAEAMSGYCRAALKNVHEDIRNKFYGCGSPIPSVLEGAHVLDLGCGTGRDCYILSQLVGEKGHVIGLDMTEEQLSVANKHVGWHMDKFGYSKPNVEFKHGYIEDLQTADIKDNSLDLIVSNCVINLAPDKEKVFSEIFRVLKPGGELYFSDIFASRRIPKELMKDPVLLGECLSGALYIEDFRRMLIRQGCLDYRIVSTSSVPIHDPDIQEKLGMVDFQSLTIRTFKSDFEDICEDYGQVARYKGSISESPHYFILDDHHKFMTGKPILVCGNTAKMLGETRYKEHFEIEGDMSTHYGPFGCGDIEIASDKKISGGCC